MESSLQGNKLTVSGELRIQELEQLVDGLRQALEASEPLEVEMSGVDGADMAGLQALVSFVLSRREIGPITIKSPSTALLRALQVSGLHPHLAAYLD